MSPLIDEMRVQIHATPMEAVPTRARWRSLRRAGLLSGGALALAVIAAAVVLIVSGGSNAPPAYAAVVHTTGTGQRTVTLTLREEQDIPQLNARLAALHTRIRVVPVVKDCDAPVHSVSNGEVVLGPAKTLLAQPTYIDDKLVGIVVQTLRVDTIAGRTTVVAASRTGFDQLTAVVVDPVPRCVGIGARLNLPS